MRVLYVLPGIQHPTMRGALRHYYFLREVALHHEVTLLALAKEEITPKAEVWATETVERLKVVRVRGMDTDGRSLRAGSLRWIAWRIRKALRLREARTRMREFLMEEARVGLHDVVVFHGKELFSVIENFRELPVVADVCDATSVRLRGNISHSRGLERVWAVLAWLRALRADRKLVRQTPHRIFISSRDRDALLPGRAAAHIIPNGIDTEYWRADERDRHPARITLTGVMDYPPNEDGALWLVNEILPRVRREIPEAEVVIAGRSPTRRIREAASRVEGVEVTGWVDDLRPHLSDTTLFAASLRFASGLQNKVLEAMAMGAPVVATSPVTEGVRVTGAESPPLETADDAEGFARALVDLLRDPGRRERLAARGRSYVERHFDWARSASLLERACVEALERADVGESDHESDSEPDHEPDHPSAHEPHDESGPAPGSAPSVGSSLENRTAGRRR